MWNEGRERFGRKRLEELVLKIKDKPVEGIVAEMEQAQKAFAGNMLQSDDIAIMVVEVA